MKAEHSLPARWPGSAPFRISAWSIALAVLSLLIVTGCQATVALPVPTAQPSATVPISIVEPGSERQDWARNATWTPGQLEAHFSKHGREGPYASIADYDRAAREAIVRGTQFTYVDRESRAQRLGFYEAVSNRFTSLTSDGRRITTFFHPDRRDNYVRGLDRSTYR
ncbi:MAG: hypothetical protein ACKVVP_04205 [Chloroflexota bacterium]